MELHTFVAVDPNRRDAFSLLGRPWKSLKNQAVERGENGVPWLIVRRSPVAIGVTALGAGRVWDDGLLDDSARQVRDLRRLELQRMNPGEVSRESHAASGNLRLGVHAERLLWAIHRALLSCKKSCFDLPDTYLGAALWGSDRSAWPHGWRQTALEVLRGLEWVHISDESGVPNFGPGTVLLARVGDLRRDAEEICNEECVLFGGPRHSHIRIDVGRGFLGSLEQFGRVDPEGIRHYKFPCYGRKSGRATLSRIGRQGRLAEIYLPSKLGEPARTSSLTDRQKQIVQALIHETTRPRRSVESRGSAPSEMKSAGNAEVIKGNLVPDFAAKGVVHCRLLSPSCEYVGFNGNGVRRGGGYRLDTDGGWVSKAGRDPRDVEAFLSDLAAVADNLELIVVGLVGRQRWLTLKEIMQLSSSQLGRRVFAKLHVRVYALADYLDRWNRYFGWRSEPPAPIASAGDADVMTFEEALDKSGVSLRKVAAELGSDHSYLAKVLKGKKRPSERLLASLRSWVQRRDHADSKRTARKRTSPTSAANSSSNLDIALTLLERGWSIVPQRAGKKKPLVKWKPFQDRPPTEAELLDWYTRWPDAGFALILGPISRAFVIDVDGEDAHTVLLERLGGEPRAPKAISGSRKPYRYHLYFRHPNVPTKAKSTPWHPKLEFRGHRGIVIIPPSLHPSGQRYAWVDGQSPNDLSLPELPTQVLDALKPCQPVPRRKAGTAHNRNVDVDLNVSPRTKEFLSGKYADEHGWNARLFEAACDFNGRGISYEDAEPLLLEGAQPWNAGEAAAAIATIQSAYSTEREPGRR